MSGTKKWSDEEQTLLISLGEIGMRVNGGCGKGYWASIIGAFPDFFADRTATSLDSKWHAIKPDHYRIQTTAPQVAS